MSQPLYSAQESLQRDPLALPRVVADHPVIIVPGLRNSDSQHWQSQWQARLPGSQRIQLADWDTPNLDAWRQGIREQLAKLNRPALLIAHSFGTLASASIAAEFPDKVAALFLVAPADPQKFGIAERLPQDFLPVPAQVVASSNDPWMSEAKAAYWALLWGADYLRFKGLGHINSQSGLGHWPEGVQVLHQFLRKAATHTKAIAA